jgi:hypothetical protein
LDGIKQLTPFHASLPLPLTQCHCHPHPSIPTTQWAPNRYASNAAFLALVAAEYGINPPKLRQYAQSQIDYVLTAGGDVNPDTKQPYYSYLIGYGDNFPRNPHHRGSSCSGSWCSCGNGGSQPNTLLGAMVRACPDEQSPLLALSSSLPSSIESSHPPNPITQ